MKIAIVDDHKLLTDTIYKTLTSALPGAPEIVTFNSPKNFLALPKDDRPDIVISDMLMPETNGIELWEKCKTSFGEDIRFALLTSVTNPRTIKLALRSGIKAYISKESPLECLIEGVLSLADNEQYLCPVVKKVLLTNIVAEEQIVYHLSPREKEILSFLCSGKTVKEIAFEQMLSVHTVQTYVKTIMKKFKINRTVDLVIFATQNGLI